MLPVGTPQRTRMSLSLEDGATIWEAGHSSLMRGWCSQLIEHILLGLGGLADQTYPRVAANIVIAKSCPGQVNSSSVSVPAALLAPRFRSVVPVDSSSLWSRASSPSFPTRPVEYPGSVQQLFSAEDMEVVLVVLAGPGVQVGGLNAVGPIAEVVDLAGPQGTRPRVWMNTALCASSCFSSIVRTP